MLAKLYSNFSDHSVLYASALFPLLNNGNLKRIRLNYFKFCKFLLYLPPWRNKPDSCYNIFISWYNFKVRDSSQKNLQYSFCTPIPSPQSYLFFSLILCVHLFFSLCVFFIFILTPPYLIYVSCGWKINK